MTEQEAIKFIDDRHYDSKSDAYKMAIKALEEIQQYRAIGTPEECRTAVELQKAKKPPVIDRPNIFVKVPVCPHCSTAEHYVPLYGKAKYCSNCGQKLDWENQR